MGRLVASPLRWLINSEICAVGLVGLPKSKCPASRCLLRKGQVEGQMKVTRAPLCQTVSLMTRKMLLAEEATPSAFPQLGRWTSSCVTVGPSLSWSAVLSYVFLKKAGQKIKLMWKGMI